MSNSSGLLTALIALSYAFEPLFAAPLQSNPCVFVAEMLVPVAFNTDGSTSHSVMWGVLSTLGYLYILHSVWMGEVAKLADSIFLDCATLEL